jgi:hypothetical protein
MKFNKIFFFLIFFGIPKKIKKHPYHRYNLIFASKRLQNNKTLIYTALLNETDLKLENDCLYLQINDYSKKLNYFKCFVNNFYFLFFKFLEFDLNFIFHFDNQKRKFNGIN